MINAFLTETLLGKALRQKSGDGIEMIIPKQNDRMSPKALYGHPTGAAARRIE
jgi:hypothetical protein